MLIKVVLDWETIDKDFNRGGISQHEIIFSQEGYIVAEVYQKYNVYGDVYDKVKYCWVLFPNAGGIGKNHLSATACSLLQRRGRCANLEDCKMQIENLLKACDIKIAPKRANIFA